MLTGGGDLRRESLRLFRRLDFERSGSLDMEEGCPRAAAMEFAKVSKEAQIFLSIVELLSWEQASLFARAALLSRGGVPETAELPGAREGEGVAGFPKQQSHREHADLPENFLQQT